MSILEETVSIFLKKNKIDFIPQKRFNFMGKKSLDFYLPKHEVAIECQGIQHYKNIDFFNSKMQQKRDLSKMKECLNNKIKIIYYTDYKNRKIVPKPYKKITYYNLRIMLNDIINGVQ